MKEQKTVKGNTATLTVNIETEPLDLVHGVHPMAGQIFYVLKQDLSDVLKENKNAIWGDLLGKISGHELTDSIRGSDIAGILRSPDTNPRKYPAALILTAADVSSVVPTVSGCYARAMDVLRVEAARFFIIDAEGKAGVAGLKTGTYYICGIGKMYRKSGIWNVRTDLKPGKNNLILNSENMTGRKK